MLSLLCVVVTDGSVVLAEMEDGQVVSKLKKTIKEEKMLDFPADKLKLVLAKTDDGTWMRFSDEDVKKLTGNQNPPPELVQSFLSKPEMEPWMPLTAYDFHRDAAKQVGVVHVLVLGPDEPESEIRPAKKAKMSVAPLAPVMTFTLGMGSVFVPTTVVEGTVQCTKTLSVAFGAFGGFPTKEFVRKEMQMVWKILHDNYVGASTPGVHYALVGSPGVGKSALLVLFCCYLATHHGYNIYLARRLKSAKDSRSSNVVVWFRGSHVTGYPACDHHILNDLKKQFEAEHVGTNNLIVCDGYLQAQLDTVMDPFVSCDLLSTSAQYRQKSDDNRELLLLPAWPRNQLQKLSTALGIDKFDERYAYSGGSVREFTRAFADLQNRSANMLRRLQAGTEIALLGNDDAPTNQDLDSFRRRFTSDIATRDGYLKQ